MDSDQTRRRQSHFESCYTHAEIIYMQKDVHTLFAHIFYNPKSQLHITALSFFASSFIRGEKSYGVATHPCFSP